MSAEHDIWRLSFERLVLHICGICGAAIPFDAAQPRPQEAEQIHADWHREHPAWDSARQQWVAETGEV